MSDVVEKVAVEIEGRDTGASATLKMAAEVVSEVLGKLDALAKASQRAAQQSVRGAQEAARAEAERARAAERSAATLVALQQRSDQQRQAIVNRGNPLAALRSQLAQELAAYHQHAAQVTGQEEQKERTRLAILAKYDAQKKAILADQARAESAAASGAAPAAGTRRFGIQGLRGFNEPMEGARMALGALGATSNTAVGSLAFLGQAFTSVGAKAGIWGAAIVGAGAAVSALVSELNKIEAEEKQVAAMGRVWGVTATDVRTVESAWRAAGVEIDRSGVLKLIAAGKQSKLTTSEIVALGVSARDAALASGDAFDTVFNAKLGETTSLAKDARKAFDDLLEAQKRAAEENRVGESAIYAADQAIATSRAAIASMQSQKAAAEATAATLRNGKPDDLDEAIAQGNRATAQDNIAKDLEARIKAEGEALDRYSKERARLNHEFTKREALKAESENGQELLDQRTRDTTRIQSETDRRTKAEAEARARAHAQLLEQVKKQREELADAEWGGQFDAERARIEIEHRKRMRAITEAAAARRGQDDDAAIDSDKGRALRAERGRYGGELAGLEVKRNEERAKAEKRAKDDADRIAKEAEDAIDQKVRYLNIGMQAGEAFVTGLKQAMESKESKDKVAGIMKTIGGILSSIPTPQTQAAGGVLSFFGTLIQSFHDGGMAGAGGRRVTAHDGRYITSDRSPVYALPGEGFTDVATTALLGGSSGMRRLNRIAETGGSAGLGGTVHVGGVSVRIDGSKIDNIAALERQIGPAIERAIIQGFGRVPRMLGRELGPLTR